MHHSLITKPLLTIFILLNSMYTDLALKLKTNPSNRLLYESVPCWFVFCVSAWHLPLPGLIFILARCENVLESVRWTKRSKTRGGERVCWGTEDLAFRRRVCMKWLRARTSLKFISDWMHQWLIWGISFCRQSYVVTWVVGKCTFREVSLRSVIDSNAKIVEVSRIYIIITIFNICVRVSNWGTAAVKKTGTKSFM